MKYKQLQINRKKNLDFKGIQTHGLCVRAAVLYQLSYEDPYIGSRPICWVHLNPWLEWNIEWRWHSEDFAVGTYRKIPKISPSMYKPPKLVTQKTLY